MELTKWKEHYTNQKLECEGNVRVVEASIERAEAEAERLKGIVLRLEGAIKAIDDLEAEEADELRKKLESSEDLSEEEIQRAIRDNQAESDSPPLEPEPSEPDKDQEEDQIKKDKSKGMESCPECGYP